MRLPAVIAAAVILAALSAPVRAANLLPGVFKSGTKQAAGITLGGPVTLNADSLSYDEDTGIAVAEGNVEIGFGNRSIRADRIRYNSETGDAELVGRVHYKEMGDEFSFDRIELNIGTELGVMYNGSIRLATNNYQIQSEKFEKIGARKFRIRKGTLTTCPCDPEPDWKFEVRRSEVTIDGYAVGKDVTFKIRGKPVLWLPWAAFPVKLTRQSGLLMPNFSHSGSKGYSFQLPFYWAISKWSDATVTLEHMSDRGLRPEVEYRYALTPSAGGEAHFTAHHDRKFDGDRYRVYGKNAYCNGDGWTSNAKWDFVSDDPYYVDLVDEDILRTGRHVASRAFIGRGSGENYGALSASWVQDLQDVPDDNTVQRLPEATAAFLPRPVGFGGIEAGGEIAAVFFYRRAGDRELRGRSYAELNRSFRLHPGVTFTPFLFLDLLGSTPTTDVYGTRSGGRVLPGGGGHVETDFRRTFEREDGKRLVHLVQSDVAFRFVPSVNQTDIPLTDQWARVTEQRQLTFSVTQRLLRLGGADNAAQGGTDNVTGPYELASLALEWALELGEREPTGSPYLDPLSPFVRSLRDQIDVAAGRIGRQREAASDVFARFQVRPSPPWTLTGETLFDTGRGNFTLAALGAEWKRSADHRASLEYRISRDLAEDLNGQFAVRPVRSLGLKTTMNYSIREARLAEGTATLTVYPRSECWNVGIEAGRKTRPDISSYKLLFSLRGIGTLGN
ncbi:MAG: LPS-assembly protein LptD [Deltaproteobacteria bacterium]|nr:LPS-assembly protein LptD [Deltaproteobacteria bacterium]